MRRATSRRNGAKDRLPKCHNARTSSQKTPSIPCTEYQFSENSKVFIPLKQINWGIIKHPENLHCQNTSLFTMVWRRTFPTFPLLLFRGG